jgi:predicted DNA-binding protein
MYFYQAREALGSWRAALGEDYPYHLICNHMDSAQRFHMGDFKDFDDNELLPSKSFDQEWGKELKPPYPFTWIDFQDSSGAGPEKAGVLISECRNENGLPLIEILPFSGFSEAWVPPAISALVNLTDTSIVDYSPTSSCFFDMFDEAAREGELYYTMMQHMCMANCFLRLINCKNIEAEIIEPPTKLNKSRQRKGKKPFLSYKVLTINAPGQGRAGSVPIGTGTTPRVHLCRGHFKTYTDDKPLLGKHTGTYWWQPLVRGDKKKGVVMKDYKIRIEAIPEAVEDQEDHALAERRLADIADGKSRTFTLEEVEAHLGIDPD